MCFLESSRETHQLHAEKEVKNEFEHIDTIFQVKNFLPQRIEFFKSNNLEIKLKRNFDYI